MIRRCTLCVVVCATATVLILGSVTFDNYPTRLAAQAVVKSDGDDQNLSTQIKDLQKQIAVLQTQVNDLKKFRIIAAGTATLKLGPRQDNKNSIRVKLPVEIVTQLGNNCIVQLTNRYPPTPIFFVPYWRPANDGIDTPGGRDDIGGVQGAVVTGEITGCTSGVEACSASCVAAAIAAAFSAFDLRPGFLRVGAAGAGVSPRSRALMAAYSPSISSGSNAGPSPTAISSGNISELSSTSTTSTAMRHGCFAYPGWWVTPRRAGRRTPSRCRPMWT